MRKAIWQTSKEKAAVGRVFVGCVSLAGIHSLLAARPTKELARRLVGSRYRNGLYRFAYNVLSVGLLGWATSWFSRLPDRELYRVRLPWSLILRMGQLASLGVLLSGVRVIGVLDFAGISHLRDLLASLDPDSEPEAQGPPMGADGAVLCRQAFRYTRHPGNLGALGVFVLLPRMTVNRAVLVGLVGIYTVLGSLHEERRLKEAYGAAYEPYQCSVPFFVPWLQGI